MAGGGAQQPAPSAQQPAPSARARAVSVVRSQVLIQSIVGAPITGDASVACELRILHLQQSPHIESSQVTLRFAQLLTTGGAI
jgi:hypothetical protein